MKEITVEEWTKALRSGDYIQGTSCLRTLYWNEEEEVYNQVRHCCLGVAEDLADITWTMAHEKDFRDEYGGITYPTVLALDKMGEVGIFLTDPRPDGSTGESSDSRVYHWLAEMNDSDFSFTHIANEIDKLYKARYSG